MTEADVAEGEIVNVATVVGFGPNGDEVESDPDTVTTNATPPAGPGPGDPVGPVAPVTPSAGGLAVTGGEIGPGLFLAAMLLAGGVLLLLVRRRRTAD